VFFQLRPTAEMVKELTEETRTSAERVRKLKQDRASTRTTSGLRLRAAPAGEHVFSQSVTTLGAPRTRVAPFAKRAGETVVRMLWGHDENHRAPPRHDDDRGLSVRLSASSVP
jgi:hypothetical protein